MGYGIPDVIAVGLNPNHHDEVRGCFQNGSPREFGMLGAILVSPDGQHMLATPEGSGLYVVSTLDGSMQRQPSDSIDGGLAGVRWSPDGQRLAYVSGHAAFLADGDGGNVRGVLVPLPLPPEGYSFLAPTQIAWSADLSHVAFVTDGMAILADTEAAQGQVVSNKLVVGVAFSPAGDKLAVGQQFLDTSSYPEGTTLVVDVASLATQETPSSIATPVWSATGDWLVQGSDLIPLSTGEAVALDSAPTVSPDHTQLALFTSDGSLHVRGFDGAQDRVLASVVPTPAGYPKWTPDGSAVWYVDDVGLRVIRASDGTPLLSAPGGNWGPGYGLMFGPDDWVAVEAADARGFRTQRLDLGPDSGAAFPATEFLDEGYTARWLDGDRLAFVSAGALRIAYAGSSGAGAICPAFSIVPFQTDPP